MSRRSRRLAEEAAAEAEEVAAEAAEHMSEGEGAAGGVPVDAAAGTGSAAAPTNLTDGYVQAAGAAPFNIYRPWCLNTKWRVEMIPPGFGLVPADLFVPMIATRRQRLGMRLPQG